MENREAVVALIKEMLDERVKNAPSLDLKAVIKDQMKEALSAVADEKLVAEPKPGDRAARFVRALAQSGGDVQKAAKFAEEKLHDPIVAKGLLSSVDQSGGFLVPEEFSREIIELLRPKSVVRSMGPRIIPMDTGVLTMPRLAGGATSSYGQEAQATKASQETLEQLRLSWKKLTTIVPISNDLLRMASPAADSIVRDDLVLSMATREDQGFIRDDGTQATVKGIRYWANTANVQNSAGVTLANVDTDIKFLIGALQNNNVRMIAPGFMMSPRSKNFFAFLRNTNGFLAYPTMAEAKPTLLGYPVGLSNNIPNNIGGTNSEIYFVDFADVVIGESTNFIVEVSNEAAYVDSNGTLQAAFSRDETLIKAISRHDLAMRHDLSAAVLTNVAYV